MIETTDPMTGQKIITTIPGKDNKAEFDALAK